MDASKHSQRHLFSRQNPEQERRNPPPRFWNELPPGTPYECKSHYIGKVTSDGWRVLSCATPLVRRTRKSGRKPRREMAYVLQKGNQRIVVPSSTVRDWFRERGGIVPAVTAQTGLGMLRERERGMAAGTHIPNATGLPYNARAGSNICLPDAPVWENLRDLVEERRFILFEQYGQEPTEQMVVAAIQSNPIYQYALQVEEACIGYWIRRDEQMKNKFVLSNEREAALRRVAAKNQGIDLASADYRDTLSEKTRKRDYDPITGRRKQRPSPNASPWQPPVDPRKKTQKLSEAERRRALMAWIRGGKAASARQNPAEPLGSFGDYERKVFPVPVAVAQNARLGLQLRDLFGSKEYRKRTRVGALRAKQLSSQSPTVTLRDVVYIRSYLRRHRNDIAGKQFKPESPSNGWMSWLLWGGSDAVAWVEGIYNSLLL